MAYTLYILRFFNNSLYTGQTNNLTQRLKDHKIGGGFLKTKNITHNNIFRFAIVTSLILLIPLLGRWPWSLGDFIVMGTLIFGTGLAYELITKKAGKNHRIAIAVVLLVALFLTWAELAVGLFGTPFAGS